MPELLVWGLRALCASVRSCSGLPLLCFFGFKHAFLCVSSSVLLGASCGVSYLWCMARDFQGKGISRLS